MDETCFSFTGLHAGLSEYNSWQLIAKNLIWGKVRQGLKKNQKPVVIQGRTRDQKIDHRTECAG